jgi:MFS family permease
VGLGSHWPTEDFHLSFVLITAASFLQFFATTPEQLIGLRILIGIGLGGITPWAIPARRIRAAPA